MEYTKNRIKKLFEFVSFMCNGDSNEDTGTLSEKLRVLTKDENLELLCKMANILDSGKDGHFSKRDTERIAEETITLFTVLKTRASAPDLETPVDDILLPFDISCRLQINGGIKTVENLLGLGMDDLSTMDARTLLEIQSAVQRLVLQPEKKSFL